MGGLVEVVHLFVARLPPSSELVQWAASGPGHLRRRRHGDVDPGLPDNRVVAPVELWRHRWEIDHVMLVGEQVVGGGDVVVLVLLDGEFDLLLRRHVFCGDILFKKHLRKKTFFFKSWKSYFIQGCHSFFQKIFQVFQISSRILKVHIFGSVLSLKLIFR